MTVLCSIMTGSGMFALLTLFLWLFWEDSKWPAFDTKDFDTKIRLLKPWNRGF